MVADYAGFSLFEVETLLITDYWMLLHDAVVYNNSLTIDMPDWMPDWLRGGQTLTLFSIPEIPTIPLLAKGGILSEGQAIVAEAGPEMIQMLGGKTVVTPLSSSARNTPAQAQSPVQGDQIFYINVQGIEQMDEVVNWYTHRRQAARAAGEGVI